MTAPFEISVICPVLVGRTPQLDLLDRSIAEVLSGHGQTVLIAGEAGIGKSRLTAEAGARFRAHLATADQLAVRILTGRCFEPDRVLPYARCLICCGPTWPGDHLWTSPRCSEQTVQRWPGCSLRSPHCSPAAPHSHRLRQSKISVS
jgi:hypothetical protein